VHKGKKTIRRGSGKKEELQIKRRHKKVQEDEKE